MANAAHKPTGAGRTLNGVNVARDEIDNDLGSHRFAPQDTAATLSSTSWDQVHLDLSLSAAPSVPITSK